MKYADFMGEGICVDLVNGIAKTTKNSLDVRDTRGAVYVFDNDSSAPQTSAAGIHDRLRKGLREKERERERERMEGPCKRK